ncbi:class I SAM-dependent methyltransferase [Formosa sp. PL04]|uniref:O-methyltransferase n=1 Tax=Formosa sp. PL04 TaxID=3081755 RepID=UPI002980B3F0|nr:class I SAM-dependent methyltransferase [Formosa sp. PL04]MDW5290053.1 class I SAM-dependent methyltransferase [Formosa sp. PL04]
MLHQIKEYLKFLKRSTNQHGVHSPFVYNLVTKCLYDKKKHADYALISSYKNALLNNKETIKITDLGSGSVYTKSNIRHINSIAKHSGAALKHAKLLYRLADYFQFTTSLELGTSLGISTHAIALGHKDNKVTSIEGCPEIAKFTTQNLTDQNITNVEILIGDFSKVIPELNQNTFDFILFDGNHNKKATLEYFELLLPKIHNNTLFIFDDIYWSKDMTEAWELIKQHPKVKVTVDTFQYGFVFFRTEQIKEHFTIRL